MKFKFSTFILFASLSAFASTHSLVSNYGLAQLNQNTLDKNTYNTVTSEKVNINSLLIKKYINDKNCDRILSNDGFFTTCYDYKHKGALYGYAKLDGEKVNNGNIDERPRFYEDLNLDKSYRTYHADYTRSGFDRGHLFSDASFDWSLKSQNATYAMSNIAPQYPNTNRKSMVAVEKYERLVASMLGAIEVLHVVKYGNSPKKIGRSRLSVPEGFGRVYWNEKEKFQRCFYIPNDDVIYDLRNMEISCKELLKGI